MKILYLLLSLLAFSSNGYSQDVWHNRIGNQSCQPSQHASPNNLQELSSAIKMASSQGIKIRAIGNAYSLSNVGCTDGCLIDLKLLNHILSIDSENKLVRVEAGILIHDLNEQLATHGLTLANQAAIDQITLGGALNTAVHGTGHTGTLSSFIREIELITADGSLHKLSASSDPDAFAAASVSLGSLGVIYAYTLQCEPMFYVEATNETSDIDTVLRNFDELSSSSDFIQFIWNPKTNSVTINRWNRCSQQNHSTQCIAAHKALPWFPIDENNKDLFSEIAVPLKSLPNTIELIQKLVTKYEAAGAIVTDLNIRLVEKDEYALLSPSSDGPVATIHFCMLETDKYIDFYKDFEQSLYIQKGRPHWGKINFVDYDSALKLYGINLQKFIDVKHRFDPNGVFSNPFTDCVLVPKPT